MRDNVLITKTVAVSKLTFPTKKLRENPTRTTLIPAVSGYWKEYFSNKESSIIFVEKELE
jgi:hypothetical protein